MTLMLIKRGTGTILKGWDAVVGSSSCAGDVDDLDYGAVCGVLSAAGIVLASHSACRGLLQVC